MHLSRAIAKHAHVSTGGSHKGAATKYVGAHASKRTGCGMTCRVSLATLFALVVAKLKIRICLSTSDYLQKALIGHGDGF